MSKKKESPLVRLITHGIISTTDVLDSHGVSYVNGSGFGLQAILGASRK